MLILRPAIERARDERLPICDPLRALRASSSNYITYIGNKLRLGHRGDHNTSRHSPQSVDETLYMRQPRR